MTFDHLRPTHCSLSLSLLGLGLGLAATLALVPTPARACGGTFCDNGPSVMPVDQSGENILFWIDHGESQPHTEAHIQIQYEGDPDRFAWIVPVTEVPEVLVSSQALFDNLLAATQPVITVGSRTDGDCGSATADSVGCGFAVVSFDASEGFSTGAGDTGWGEEGDDGPEIIDRGFAGAFEYVVLTADTVDVIVDWLDQAGYAQDPDAPPILEEYLEEGFVFVAFKLRGGTGTNEIHPLAIRYPGVEPCIPIRLTRIAATEDMAIRAFFLGQDRVVPQNWPHVELNLTKLDWLGNTAADYLELVSLAIDEAGGRAFVTEFAGSDTVVSTAGIKGNLWNADAFVDIEPVDLVATLDAQGLVECVGLSCEFSHPQVRPLLQRYLPVPEGLSEAEFWTCVECYEGLIDPVAWGAQPGFAAEFEERVVEPGRHGLNMLADAVYLTRLFTLLSPHEMLEDPLFHETSSLDTVDNNIRATQVFSCDESPDYMEFEDGSTVALDEVGNYPAFDDMPSAARIERVPMMGPPQVETDNTTEIDDIIDNYNRDKLVGPSPWNCSIARLRPEALLSMLALFGIAWLQRSPRRRRGEG
jgi:hypothetical protein